MKKVFLAAVLMCLLAVVLPAPVFAQVGILPAVGQNVDCKKILDDFQKKSNAERQEQLTDVGTQSTVLGCAVRTGRISAKMLPFFLTYLIRFFIGLAGIISVLFIVVGGYKYVIGGISDDKESGKKTILYAITGLVVSLLAWIIVNIIQVQITR